MAAVTSLLGKLTTPAWYRASYQAWFNSYRPHIRNGSAVPLFHLMVLVGVSGYTLEYLVLGQHHVAEEKQTLAKAMEEYKAKHSHGHH
eukprot:CAMPEP_0113942944 /NCGR_PEP_ID=MMETSP1339-20121228/14970_1 /TAXON_ID=94617 /ORGANISM="Fibrocapsa japonica" /LENGTH=87 /DNA_ID=CAMNT_0000947641 /DNA_START=71 /DNA_END=334 /DNA_ORIENTATION=+ /assembly_acc=CAM_ASM_000762